jgi:hypothetical protein
MVGLFVRAVCTALSLSFAFLFFQVADDPLKSQLALLTASSIVVGIAILAFLAPDWKIKGA